MTAATVNVDVLKNQVDGLSTEFDSLKSDMNARFTQFGAQVTEQIKGIVSKLDERSKIPWTAVGIMISVIGGVGSAYILPLKDNTARIEAAIERFADRAVSVREYDVGEKSTDRRFAKVEADVAKLQSDVVSRSELSHVWEMQDARMAGIERRGDELRGQVFSSAQARR